MLMGKWDFVCLFVWCLGGYFVIQVMKVVIFFQTLPYVLVFCCSYHAFVKLDVWWWEIWGGAVEGL